MDCEVYSGRGRDLVQCYVLFFLFVCRFQSALANNDQAPPSGESGLIQSTRVIVGTSPRKPVEGNWEEPYQLPVEGKVFRFNAKELVIQRPGKAPSSISSDQVEDVDLRWSHPTVVRAFELLSQRKYQQAVSALSAVQRDAVKLEMPRWKQRFVIAAIVRCADALGNPKTAAIVFKNLTDSSAPALLYADMPLNWINEETPVTLAESSKAWLESSDEVEQLLGASWELMGPRSDQARSLLQQLKGSGNLAIRSLAEAQSWRLVPPPETLSSLAEWNEFRETLIPDLQIGLTEFIADRLLRIGETELAIGELVRIASQHGDRYHRAARALKSSRTQLLEQGKAAEAQRLDAWIKQLDAE